LRISHLRREIPDAIECLKANCYRLTRDLGELLQPAIPGSRQYLTLIQPDVPEHRARDFVVFR